MAANDANPFPQAPAPAGPLDESDFVISRLFDAPRELVWKAHTDCAHLKHWWGPKGSAVKVCKLDLRPGGTFHYCLRTPDGQDMWGKFVYREIVAPERLVFIVSFSDEKGGITRHPWNPNWPRQTFSTLTFAVRGQKTEVTVRWAPYEATEIERRTFFEGRESMNQGWGGTMDKLATYLAEAAKEETP